MRRRFLVVEEIASHQKMKNSIAKMDGRPFEAVYLVFVAGAIDSYIEDLLVVMVSFLVGVPLLIALRKIPGFKYPLS